MSDSIDWGSVYPDADDRVWDGRGLNTADAAEQRGGDIWTNTDNVQLEGDFAGENPDDRKAEDVSLDEA